jgi:hypothetical protein
MHYASVRFALKHQFETDTRMQRGAVKLVDASASQTANRFRESGQVLEESIANSFMR